MISEEFLKQIRKAYAAHSEVFQRFHCVDKVAKKEVPTGTMCFSCFKYDFLKGFTHFSHIFIYIGI